MPVLSWLHAKVYPKVFEKDMAKMDLAPVSAFSIAAGRGLWGIRGMKAKRGDPFWWVGWGPPPPPPPPPGRNVSPGDRPRRPQRQGKTQKSNTRGKPVASAAEGGLRVRPTGGSLKIQIVCFWPPAARRFFFDRGRRRPPAARPCANIGRNYYFHFRRRGGD